jgi:hypothetical protein
MNTATTTWLDTFYPEPSRISCRREGVEACGVFVVEAVTIE